MFSVKSLGNIAILNLLNSQGAGFDIVSGGELFRALKAGADPKKIIFSGVGKSSVEVAAGIKALYGTPFRYNNHKVSVRKSDLIALDA